MKPCMIACMTTYVEALHSWQPMIFAVQWCGRTHAKTHMKPCMKCMHEHMDGGIVFFTTHDFRRPMMWANTCRTHVEIACINVGMAKPTSIVGNPPISPSNDASRGRLFPRGLRGTEHHWTAKLRGPDLDVGVHAIHQTIIGRRNFEARIWTAQIHAIYQTTRKFQFPKSFRVCYNSACANLITFWSH